jgi:hypothetical protein
MKKISAVVVMLAVTAFAGAAFAAGPETIVLENKKGNITFPHKKHQEIVKQDCKKCHQKGPGKIEGKNMKWGHDLCKACHTEKGAPTKCDACHKK